MPIGDGSRASEESDYCESVANSSSEHSRIYSTPGGCDEHICAGE